MEDMTPQQRRSVRREQVERCLASGMTIKEWCSLNHMPESTFYRWLARFRREEPEAFGGGGPSQWIELSREAIAAQTALAVSAAASPTARRPEGVRGKAGAPPIVVHLNGADVAVPAGSAEPDVSAVLRAVAGL